MPYFVVQCKNPHVDKRVMVHEACELHSRVVLWLPERPVSI